MNRTITTIDETKEKNEISTVLGGIKQQSCLPNDMMQIYFNDGSFLIIKSDWNKENNLASVSLLRTQKEFLKYINPILLGDSLINKNLDEKIELNEFITAVKSYNIMNKLTPQQITDASNSFIELINKLSVEKEKLDTKCLNRSYLNRLLRFRLAWDKTIDSLGTATGVDYSKIHYDSLLSALENFPLQNLCEINIKQYSNKIYQFFDHMYNVVILKDSDGFDKFCESVENLLPKETKQLEKLLIDGVSRLSSSLGSTVGALISGAKLVGAL